MSARRGHAWRVGGTSALYTRTGGNRASRPTYLPDCPAEKRRVAIFTPAGAVAQVRMVELINGRLVVELLGKRITAEPCEPHPDAPGARFKVTMPTQESSDEA